MERTEADLEQTARRAAVQEHPALLVGYHPNRAFSRAFFHLRAGADLVMGRGHEALGVGGLDDGLISREHLAIRRRGSLVEAQELGSQNGTLYNGTPLTGTVVLNAGDVLALGRVCLVYQLIPAHHRAATDPLIVGTGPATAKLLEDVARVAPTEVPILVRGEAGVGKELVARALHDKSQRPGGFVAVNCGAVADGVLHSELFGHVRGAFSGASEARAGLVKDAEEGTLLLDEIGDASAAFQVALLRLLEQAEYRAVGSDTVQRASVRIIAATHVDLSAAVEAGSFRHDLFTRITQRVIRIAPLRERPEDVLAIAHHLLAEEGRGDVSISRTMAQQLLSHDWPGNVRELKGVILQALSEVADGESLILQEPLDATRPQPTAAPDPTQRASRRPHKRPSATELRELFRVHGGNMQAVASALGVGRNTLYRWFRDADLDPAELRKD